MEWQQRECNNDNCLCVKVATTQQQQTFGSSINPWIVQIDPDEFVLPIQHKQHVLSSPSAVPSNPVTSVVHACSISRPHPGHECHQPVARCHLVPTEPKFTQQDHWCHPSLENLVFNLCVNGKSVARADAPSPRPVGPHFWVRNPSE